MCAITSFHKVEPLQQSFPHLFKQLFQRKDLETVCNEGRIFAKSVFNNQNDFSLPLPKRHFSLPIQSRFLLHLYPNILRKRTALYVRLPLRASGFTRVMIISSTFFSSKATPVNSA